MTLQVVVKYTSSGRNYIFGLEHQNSKKTYLDSNQWLCSWIYREAEIIWNNFSHTLYTKSEQKFTFKLWSRFNDSQQKWTANFEFLSNSKANMIGRRLNQGKHFLRVQNKVLKIFSKMWGTCWELLVCTYVCKHELLRWRGPIKGA